MKIGMKESVLELETCEEIISEAKPNLTPAKVTTSNGSRVRMEAFRGGDNWKIPRDHHLFELIGQAAADVVEMRPERIESIEVVEYRVGDCFRRHSDGAKRSMSVAIALNTDYEGGLLHFVRLKKIWQPDRPGDAFAWESGHPAAEHEIQKITAGAKWSAVVWFSA